MPCPNQLSVALLALAILAGSAAAQTSITGVVVENGSERPLPDVHLLLLDQEGDVRGETLSDDSGSFVLEVPGAGAFRISGSLIGYATIRSDFIRMQTGDELTVEILMDIQAVLLEPLVVQGRVNRLGPDLAGFYDRMARGERSGFGHFISREEVERRSAFQSTDLLRMVPGVHVVSGGGLRSAGVRMTGGCIPAIYVDGMQVNRPPLRGTSIDDLVPPVSLEGIEIYRGPSANQGRFHDPSGCGLILIWTRRGDDSGRAWSWRRFLAGAGLFAGLLFLLR